MDKKFFFVMLILPLILVIYGCGGSGGGGNAEPTPSVAPTSSPTVSPSPTDTPTPSPSPTSSPVGLEYEESFFGVFNSHDHDAYGPFKEWVGLDEQGFYDWADYHQSVLKFHWSRTNTELVWDVVEPDFDGNYVWNNFMDADDNIAAFRKTGQVNLWLVIEGNRRDGNRWQDNKEKFQAYVRACVERYDGDGIDDAPGSPTVKYWQALNERGMGGATTADQQISIEDYITYVTWMEEAVHDSDPEAKIILVAQAPLNDEIHSDMKEIIDGLMSAGVPFDIVDMHSWGPCQNWQMPEIADAREYLDSRGLTNVQLWSGENGTWIGQPGNAMEPQTEEQQAIFLAKRYAYGPSVGLSKLFWNNLCEWYNFAGRPDSQFNSMGLVGDGHCNGEDPSRLNKPRVAYYAYSMLSSAIDRPENEYVGVMSITDNNNIYGYEYREKSTGKSKFILWRESGESEVTFGVSSDSVLVTNLITDLEGNIQYQETISAKDGEVTLNVAEDPLLVVEQ
ncbi:MAG: hypothetical protein K8T10_14030 [Candidatus Eremiobacteraeota bacterium]|nr:hypothetical protein [Candidatus Eremiobacteraeota bacterium]